MPSVVIGGEPTDDSRARCLRALEVGFGARARARLSQGHPVAQALLDESVEIRLPTLWRYEVGNVLGLKKPTLAVELMSALLAYEFEEVPLRTDYGLAVLEHMREVKHVTFYDSAYNVLVIRAKAKGHVVLLSEWKGPAT